jgi:prepilin-type N-terminal cleavage/methylation domain-containing protein
MRSRFFAFTLIEILIVLAIILVLLALIIPKFSPVQQKVLRVSCARNVKALLDAIHIYSASHTGQWKKITPESSINVAFGSLFQKEGWNNLSQLVCPANSVGKAPKPNPLGYGAPLDAYGTSIDYWIVHAGNTTGTPSTLTPSMAPGNNVLLIERFSGKYPSCWISSDFHKEGGTVGRVNGSAEFLTVWPQNTNDQGGTEFISKTVCTSD